MWLLPKKEEELVSTQLARMQATLIELMAQRKAQEQQHIAFTPPIQQQAPFVKPNCFQDSAMHVHVMRPMMRIHYIQIPLIADEKKEIT